MKKPGTNPIFLLLGGTSRDSVRAWNEIVQDEYDSGRLSPAGRDELLIGDNDTRMFNWRHRLAIPYRYLRFALLVASRTSTRPLTVETVIACLPPDPPEWRP